MTRTHLVGIVAAAFVALARAQVPHDGSPRSFAEASISDKTAIIAANPTEDIAALIIAADGSAGNRTKYLGRKDEVGGHRVGVAVDVKASLTQFSADTLADGTVVHRLTVRSTGALGMGVNFDRYQLPAGAELYVYNGNKTMVRGAFTDWNHKPEGNFAVTPVSGDVLVVEVVVPAAAAAEPIAVVVGSIVHHYLGTRLTGSHGATHPSVAGRARSGSRDSCAVDAKCQLADNYKDAVRGVAFFLAKHGTTFYSGSMINNVEQDGKQYFLTAYSSDAGNNDIVVFNYESDECGNPSNQLFPDSAHGLVTVAKNRKTGFLLAEISERIPERYGVYLTGFAATPSNDPMDDVFETAFSISHPAGDIKKVAYFGGFATKSRGLDKPPRGSLGAQLGAYWLVAEWDHGVTGYVGGDAFSSSSTGSPVLDHSSLIRGQLTWGMSNCNYRYTDWYGQMAVSWDNAKKPEKQLARWLDPEQTGTTWVGGGDLNTIRAARAAKDAEETPADADVDAPGAPDTPGAPLGNGAVPLASLR